MSGRTSYTRQDRIAAGVLWVLDGLGNAQDRLRPWLSEQLLLTSTSNPLFLRVLFATYYVHVRWQIADYSGSEGSPGFHPSGEKTRVQISKRGKTPLEISDISGPAAHTLKSSLSSLRRFVSSSSPQPITHPSSHLELTHLGSRFNHHRVSCTSATSHSTAIATPTPP
ncbi:hypothetical protein BDP67DRAFT_244867 [Colletotrichum lupini]|nr:hypothetical protein BDP67DRAFT_244867 [Colletotrichum lupini]